jgi:hypothetical protein
VVACGPLDLFSFIMTTNTKRVFNLTHDYSVKSLQYNFLKFGYISVNVVVVHKGYSVFSLKYFKCESYIYNYVSF